MAVLGAALALPGAALLGAVLPDAAQAATGGLAGVSVYPTPGDRYEQPGTQITFRGIAPRQIGSVTVTGSQTGNHPGRLLPDSDGQGASFIPNQPFAPGETVTVTTGLPVIGGVGGKFSFTIDHPDAPLGAMSLPLVTARSGVQRFRSRPDLQPASVSVTTDQAPASEGDIFVAPQFGPTQDGPMILSPTGQLIWFAPYPVGQKRLVTDFRVQQLFGQPVLTWFEGTTISGTGSGDGVIYNDRYQLVARVNAGNGLRMDLHEFLLTNSGDAYIIAVAPIAVPGQDRPVLNPVFQEIDVRTGLVLWQWDAMDHIPLSDSYLVGPHQPGHVVDPFHANSISLDPNGNIVVSLRNTSAVYELDRSTGRVLWEFSGKHPSFKMGPGTGTAFQHDAELQPNGQLTVFDDGAGPPRVHPQSRGLVLSLAGGQATIVHQFLHNPGLSANFEGSVQVLPDGNYFVGWGQQPYFTEFNSSGKQIFDGRFVAPSGSYRAYRFPWQGQPLTTPAMSLGTSANGSETAWASWNGAAQMTGWRFMAGPSASSLSPIRSYAQHHFESTLTPGTGEPYVQVEALSGGTVLSQTTVQRVPNHVQIFGGREFVPPSGLTGVPVGCYSSKPCRLSATVTAGRRVVARSGKQGFGAGRAGLLFFRLSPAARREVADRSSHTLGVSVSVNDANGAHGARAGQALVEFVTSGPGPKRSYSPGSALRIIGGTDFVSPQTGMGATMAECTSNQPCRVSATVTIGGRTVAQSRPEYIGAQQVGQIFYKLNGAARSRLAHTRGNQLGASVTLSGNGQKASADVVLVAFR